MEQPTTKFEFAAWLSLKFIEFQRAADQLDASTEIEEGPKIRAARGLHAVMEAIKYTAHELQKGAIDGRTEITLADKQSGGRHYSQLTDRTGRGSTL